MGHAGQAQREAGLVGEKCGQFKTPRLARRLLESSHMEHRIHSPRTTDAALALFTAAFVWVSLPADARADTYTNITLPGPNTGEILDGRIYLPDPLPPNPPAVIMMHGCSGMWEGDYPGNGATREIERWGLELAAQGYVALAIDSYEARRPSTKTYVQYQNQCSMGSPLRVDPYTTRVADIGAALDYLIDTHDVNTDGGVGLLGWSQGAQAVLVAMAKTPRYSNVPHATDPPYAAAVAFYPGCGAALGYNFNVDGGFWRPANPMRLHMGDADETVSFDDCEARVETAHDDYGNTPGTEDELIWVPYAGIGHTFDQACDGAECSEPYPFATAKCASGPTTYNCARKDADIDSLDFFLTEVVGG
ncbi:dienelactone hydrolase family protein [Nannocystis punicea]|uniref:Dienelactone hydrolase family protein n=1 Tax=Nannocystis punicea TaxID=2995304 RepID=A0ABY7HBB2_9BACT|nr:dienelactone hydrolase family protein [Nannocystis poenicansa]WAS96496.1 dienelactone hydrolase family protein [Nannocystis poenicansa]